MAVQKTFKREVAIALLLWLVYVVEVKDVAIVEVLVWPIFAFLGAAFGLDAYSKQLQQSPKSPNGRGTESSSQYTSGQDQYPDGGYDK